jgi:putative DNA primase/helicase
VSRFDHVPAELRARNQWVVWRVELRDGKPTKVPYRADGGGRASSTASSTWASFVEAVDAVERLGMDGIGFVFTKDDPLCGTDLDDCRDPKTGALDPAAWAIVERLDSYTEASPSGRGMKVIVRASKNGVAKSRKPMLWGGQIEIYDERRFFTITGDLMLGVSGVIEARQAQVDVLLRELFPPAPPPVPRSPTQPVRLDDRELVEKATAAKNGAKFSALWQGDISGYRGDDSAADQAFCNLLAFWTNRDPNQIDRLFRQSGLMRDKWLRDDYRERTIAKAIAVTTEGYDPASLPSSSTTRTDEAAHTSDRHTQPEASGEQTAVDVVAPPDHTDRDRPQPVAIVPLADFLSGCGDVADWVVDHLIAGGALTLFAGLPKVGKSTFVYGMLGAISTGTPFLGLDVASASVLLLTEEPAITVEEKADRFSLDDSRVWVLPKRRIRSGRKWPRIVADGVAFCREHPEIQVVVVDTIDKFADLDAKRSESDTGVIREMVDPLYELLDLGVAVVLITHQRKQEGEHGLRVRGGTSLTGSADVIAELERAPASAGLPTSARVLKIVSRFEGTPDEITVELDERWRAIGSLAAAKRRARREQVLELLTPEPQTLDEIHARADGVSQRTLRYRLEELVADELAEREGAGVKGDPWRWWLSQSQPGFNATPENGFARTPQGPLNQDEKFVHEFRPPEDPNRLHEPDGGVTKSGATGTGSDEAATGSERPDSPLDSLTDEEIATIKRALQEERDRGD